MSAVLAIVSHQGDAAASLVGKRFGFGMEIQKDHVGASQQRARLACRQMQLKCGARGSGQIITSSPYTRGVLRA
jgi:hypothetical protein